MRNNRSYGMFLLFLSVFFIGSYSTMEAMLSTATNPQILISVLMKIVWSGGAVMCAILGTYYALKK